MSLSTQTEGFDKIVDPETNKLVPTASKVGQQVLKNYIETIKNGADSTNIVSTKMFYKRKPKKRTSKLGTINESGTVNKSNLGDARGTCPVCTKLVYTSQQRIKHTGIYYHEKCFQLKSSKPV